MKAAMCSICRKPEAYEKENQRGGWVEFADYDPIFVNTMFHPQGLEYFCDEHVSAARKLCDKNSADALEELNVTFAGTRYFSYKEHEITRPWWKRWLFG